MKIGNIFAARLSSSTKPSTSRCTAACNRSCPRTSKHVSLCHEPRRQQLSAWLCKAGVWRRRRRNIPGDASTCQTCVQGGHAAREPLRWLSFPLSSSTRLSPLKSSVSQGTNGFFPPQKSAQSNSYELTSPRSGNAEEANAPSLPPKAMAERSRPARGRPAVPQSRARGAFPGGRVRGAHSGLPGSPGAAPSLAAGGWRFLPRRRASKPQRWDGTVGCAWRSVPSRSSRSSTAKANLSLPPLRGARRG